jgi:hypothetical protein
MYWDWKIQIKSLDNAGLHLRRFKTVNLDVGEVRGRR